MAAPTETPPATTATEPEVAKDAKDATLTVDVAATADKGETKQQPAESPEVVTPGGTILAKVDPPEGVLACGFARVDPKSDGDKKDDDEAAGDKKDDEAAPKEVSESVKRARESAETLEEALQTDGDKKEAAAAEEPPAKKAAVEPGVYMDDDEAENGKFAWKSTKEEGETPVPPAVTRQMTTLSPEADAAAPPPALRREATVAA